jgi:hypothetical protein
VEEFPQENFGVILCTPLEVDQDSRIEPESLMYVGLMIEENDNMKDPRRKDNRN